MDLGARQAGLVPRLVTDIDFDCVRTLTKSLSEHPGCWLKQADMKELLWSGALRRLEGQCDIVIGGPPCFTAGTPVVTARGVIGIENVCEGDIVLTHTGRWQPVTAVMSRQAKVITDGQITATPDHPFWARARAAARYGPSTRTGGGRKFPFTLEPASWVNARDTTGAYLAIPVTTAPVEMPEVPVAGKENLDFWYAVGRWLGDGWLRIDTTAAQHKRYSALICCSHDEAGALEEYLALTGLRWHRQEQVTTVRFEAASKSLTLWLRANFGQLAHGKTLPGWLLAAPKEIRRAVLSGYVDADGSSRENLVFRATTVSKELAVGIRLLASTLGYTTSLEFTRRPVTCSIEGRTVNQRDTWTVSAWKDDGRYTRLEDGHRWVKQRRQWHDAGTETVYDLTVAEDHSFIAHGFAVHNCQGFSVAGRMDPEDPRSEQVFLFMNAVSQIRPTAFLMENVAALASKRWSLILERLRRSARLMGYTTYVMVLNAAHYGTAQNRERLFLFGVPKGCLQPAWPEAVHYVSTVRGVLEDLNRSIPDTFPSAKITLAKNPVLRKSPYAGMLVNGGGRVIDLDTTAPTLPATMGGNRTPIIDLDALEHGATPWIEGYHADLMEGESPLAEIPRHVRMRRLSMNECAAIQGFPESYPFAGNVSSRWRQIGNAVPPQLGEVAIRALLRALG